MKERVKILGIPFDRVTREKALETVFNALKKGKKFFIATPNPEILLAAKKNKELFQILQKTDLNIADGTGVIFASKIIRKKLPERVTGTDLMIEICKWAGLIGNPEQQWWIPSFAGMTYSIFLLGAEPGIADMAARNLENRFPGLRIVGTFPGTPNKSDGKLIREIINKKGPDILFVAYGSPAQELWIARNLHHLKTVKVVMGVGGAFDFIAGVRKRAPQWMQKCGIEWLYRLLKEPRRIKRIMNAAVKFPIEFLRHKR